MGRSSALAFALLALFPSSGAWSQPSSVRSVYLRSAAEAVDEPLALTFDRRLTIVAPQVIRMAVPGSPDVLGVSVKERAAVVTLVDSDFVRKERPGTNLTLLLADGSAVALRLTVASRPAEATVDLVNLEQAPVAAGLETTAEALRLVRKWATDQAAAPPEVRAALQPAGDRQTTLVDDSLLQRFARSGAALVERPGRDQRRFVYASGEQALVLGEVCLLRLSLTNRSQPTFRLDRVTLREPGEGEAGTPPFFAADREVLPDSRPRPVAVRLVAERCRAPLSLELCEAAPGERCVPLELAGP